MNSSTSIDLGHLDVDLNAAASELQFQEFSDVPVSPVTVNRSQIVVDNNDSLIPDTDADGDEDPILGQKQQQAGQGSGSVFDLEFFARYFDITTHEFGQRILWSAVPAPGASDSYMDKFIRNNPDLYGPLWVNVTLIFSIAICGNIANYLSSGDPDKWHYDFAKVSLAASTVSTYVCAVPIALWLFFWFRGCTLTFTLFQMVCLYGYSTSVYVPISLLWVICSRSLQYVLIIIGALASGTVLVFSFAPVVKSDPSQTIKLSYLIFLVIIGLHALVAFAFLMYFF